MSKIAILLKNARGLTLGSLVLDATISESHKSSSRVTQFPVESGGSISDHIANDPDSLTIEGFVSDTPLLYSWETDRLAQQEEEQGAPLPAGYYTKQAVETLDKIHTSRQPIAIDTPIRQYTDMALTSLDIPRSASTGEALYFTASFQKIVKAESRTVEIPADSVATASKNTATSTANKGVQQPEDTSAETEAAVEAKKTTSNNSWLSSILGL